MNLKSSYKEENASYLVELEISAEEMENQFQALLKKHASSLTLHGFRKGKVPPSLVEKKFGEELGQSVLEEIIPKAIEETIKTHSLETIGPAELEKDHPKLKFERQQPLSLKLVLSKKPKCEIQSYEGLSIVKKKYSVKEEDVLQNKKRILDSLGKNLEIDDSPSFGDMVHLDLSFKDDSLKNLNLKDHIVIFDQEGKNTHPQYLIPLYQVIHKMKKGDSQETEFNFPKDIEEEKLKGRKEFISLTINRVSRFQAAELNQEVLDRLQIKDEEELMKKIKKDMEDHAQEQSEKQSYDEAITALKKNTVFVIPEIAVGYFLQSSWNQLAQDLQMRGQNNVPDAPPEAWLKENHEHARGRIETDLLISKVREDQKIEVGEEEMENKIKEMAEMSKADVANYRKELIKSGGFSELKKQMGQRKTLDWILSQCQVSEEKECSYAELEKLTQRHY